MKKLLSLVLALVLLCSLSVTAFAEGGTMTLTANIPNAAEPSYTLHIPASTTLEYGNTDLQFIGNVSVTDVQNCDMVAVDTPYTMLINTDDSSDTLDWDLFIDASIDGSGIYEVLDPSAGYHMYGGGSVVLYDDEELGYLLRKYYAQVSDWSGATPGATYQAVVTFNVWTW